ncbi:MAG: zinc ribbon domain-containing protein [Bryobacterales bacterium]|nr:zinc ribbon domain-containing protein [Bryobacteraceae bacterium]MDW8354633.1 zinc ribbon domain-containing protein [Bryobacterales bacterium]
MPIYEYRCEDCGRRVSLFLRRMEQESEAACPRCGSRRLSRLWSRFAIARSEESRLERLADEASLAALDENDPKSVARWVKRMGQELGEDMGEDFEQALEEIEQEEASAAKREGEGGAEEDSEGL